MLRYKENSPEIHRTFLKTVVLLSTLEWFVDLLYFCSTVTVHTCSLAVLHRSRSRCVVNAANYVCRVCWLVLCIFCCLHAAELAKKNNLKIFTVRGLAWASFLRLVWFYFFFLYFAPFDISMSMLCAAHFFWRFSFVSRLASVTSECIELNRSLLLSCHI